MVLLLQESKLMYGMLFSIKSFVNRMSPTDQYPLNGAMCTTRNQNWIIIRYNVQHKFCSCNFALLDCLENLQLDMY